MCSVLFYSKKRPNDIIHARQRCNPYFCNFFGLLNPDAVVKYNCYAAHFSWRRQDAPKIARAALINVQFNQTEGWEKKNSEYLLLHSSDSMGMNPQCCCTLPFTHQHVSLPIPSTTILFHSQNNEEPWGLFTFCGRNTWFYLLLLLLLASSFGYYLCLYEDSIFPPSLLVWHHVILR